MKRVLTGLQPTGLLHLGNYFGAIEPMVRLQEGNELFMFVPNYHAITVPQRPDELRRNTLYATAVYLAAGIDPTKTTIFPQSLVSQHTELGWILNCTAKMGELERMTQYKDKSADKVESVSVGLFDYPVLMAADILLYDTLLVPVGADQKQHVELARDLAERFNKQFGQTFIIPEPMIRKDGARIMGLDNPEKKMSKSASSPKNYISLMDDPATVEKKIKSAVTDSGTEVKGGAERPALANLLMIFSLVTGKTVAEIEAAHAGQSYGTFKQNLADAVNAWLAPLQQKILAFSKDEAMLIKVLEDGAKKAQAEAEAKMKLVRQKIGVAL